jgi:predicted PurR-regulated permease PerM
MQTKQIQRYLFLALFLFLFLFVARLFSPFFSVLLWAGLLYVITLPLYERVVRGIPDKPMGRLLRKFLAAVFSLVSVLIVVIPLLFLGSTFLGQARDLIQSINDFLKDNPEFFRTLDTGTLAIRLRDASGGLIDITRIDLLAQLSEAVTTGAEKFVATTATLLRNTASFVVSLAFLTFTLYFFYVDGKDLILIFVNAVPIEKTYTTTFLRRFGEVGKHLFRGYLLVSLYQGTAAYLIFLLFGVKGSLPLGLLTAIASFVPMVGTTLVWGPVGVARIASGDPSAGIAILIISFVLVSGVDNLLRPLLLTVRIKIHPLLVFFSIMGGLKLFGLNGLILGPMMLMLFFTGVDLFDQAYGPRKTGTDPEPDAESTGGEAGFAENGPEAPPAIGSDDGQEKGHEAVGP